jgi:hypothetical protein
MSKHGAQTAPKRALGQSDEISIAPGQVVVRRQGLEPRTR